MATYQTITFKELIKGANWNGVQFNLYTNSAYTSAKELDGCIITADLRQSPKSIAQARWSTEDSTITISGTDNNIVTLHGRNMNVPVGQYYMDVDIFFPSGANKTYIRILWRIIDEYTY